MRDRARITDAATNRAAEALRVMEDAARFLLDDRALTGELKQLRHDLRSAAPSVAHRDTASDVGTTVSTEAELTRASARDVVTAASKRLQESLRSLEEWSKLLSPSPRGRGAGGEGDAPASVAGADAATTNAPSPQPSPSGRGSRSAFYESARYRAYTLEQRLLDALPRPFTGWRLCLLLTESLCAHPWPDVARAAIDGGADAVQLREKDLSDRDLLDRARALVDLANGRADVVINDRPDIALAAGASAVHLGQTDLPLAEARAIVGDRLLIGVSTSNINEAEAARAADYCGVGPMFPSTTKAKPTLSGPDYLRAYLAREPALPPALAISGVTPETIPVLTTAAGGRPFGVAVSSFICAADDPAAATRAILETMPALP